MNAEGIVKKFNNIKEDFSKKMNLDFEKLEHTYIELNELLIKTEEFNGVGFNLDKFNFSW